MKLLMVAVLALSMQQANPGLENLAGKWVSTVQPPPGEAPMIAPSFTVGVKDGKATVSIPGQSEPLQATVFSISKTEVLLMMRAPLRRGTQVIIIRPVKANQVSFEMYAEVSGGNENYFYSEIFKKAS